jgi:hypothetical protein
MGDADYEKEYLARKRKLKGLHTKLSDSKSKHIQEIYHKIMGSTEGHEASDDSTEEEE